MPWYSGTLFTTSGVTGSLLSQRLTVNTLSSKFPFPMATAGMIGLSTTNHVAGQTFRVDVFHGTAGSTLYIGGLTISSADTSPKYIPLVSYLGTTQLNYVGVPVPSYVSITGSSAGVGLTLSCSLYGSFYAPS